MSYACEHPKDHWEVKLEECSKAGLISMIETLAFVYDIPRESMLHHAIHAKKMGRFIDSDRRHRRFVDDPDAYELRRLQRKAKALKAKRKRKQEVA